MKCWLAVDRLFEARTHGALLPRSAIPLLAALLGGCTAAAASGGGGIVSTNPCADAMLVDLVAADRIAAISHYSQDPGATSMALDVARRFRATAGTAEEVIALKPDLVVTDSFTPAASRAAYRRAGLNVLELGWPTSIDDSEQQVMTVARAVGAEVRGKAMVERIEAELRRPMPSGRSPRTLLYLSGDLVNGPGTMLDEMMTRTGLANAAADYGLAHSGSIAVESLIGTPPDVILTPDVSRRHAAALARILAGRTRFAHFPRSLVNCGGPVIVAALTRLRAIRAGGA
ncbi:MAG: ABC transporter substrate-binding protein [Sphingomonas sp.]|jgi:iron complex transport system substrate-binding protein